MYTAEASTNAELFRDWREERPSDCSCNLSIADAGAYVVVHVAKYTRSLLPGGEGSMTLTVIAARLRKIAADIEALPPVDRERDIPDEMVQKLVMNAFVDDKVVAAFRTVKSAAVPE
jgi:hypothetical protein